MKSLGLYGSLNKKYSYKSLYPEGLDYRLGYKLFIYKYIHLLSVYCD